MKTNNSEEKTSVFRDMQSEINALSKISEEGEDLSIAQQTAELKKLLTSMKETEVLTAYLAPKHRPGDQTNFWLVGRALRNVHRRDWDDEEVLEKIADNTVQEDNKQEATDNTQSASTTTTDEAKDCKREGACSENSSNKDASSSASPE
eukprot:CAMPEP_0170182798 /NCGR_PEP_ID=MMETSP0040_2-20121228/28855_1 /TAXON_ID=641309 /ORGANISM="Lotharella oceanica, Strain CCMP622" /LENGTH=148 /DNA_ID=CAMNT_0010428347 /DNA_START=12 /DNA_END=459 /DNA_ORIENTATION=-